MSRNGLRRIRELPPVRTVKALLRSPRALLASIQEWWIGRQIPPHELAIGAIFRNEACNLVEWLTFHRGTGVTHFYLYNNNSTDNYLEVLRPWIAEGLVTLTEWPVSPGQRSAYMHCVRKRWRDARWIAFIDLDEFLFSPQQIDIRSVLRRYADVPALYVYCLVFGSSEHTTRPAMPVIEAYVRRETLCRTDTGKSIVNPRFVRNVPNSHHFALWKGRTVDTSRRPTASPTGKVLPDRAPVYDILRINHYFCKSRDDLRDKAARGDAFYGTPRDFNSLLAADTIANAEEDLTILPIWRGILSQ